MNVNLTSEQKLINCFYEYLVFCSIFKICKIVTSALKNGIFSIESDSLKAEETQKE